MLYTINQDDKSIKHKDVKHFLPRKEFMIFTYLHDNPNKIISRASILDKIWEDGVVVDSRTIDVHVRRIRKRFPDAPIITRRCFGYMWEKK